MENKVEPERVFTRWQCNMARTQILSHFTFTKQSPTKLKNIHIPNPNKLSANPNTKLVSESIGMVSHQIPLCGKQVVTDFFE